MSRVELWGRPGSALTVRVAAGLAAAGREVATVQQPTGSAPWIDLALERSPDGLRPPPTTAVGPIAAAAGVVVSSTLALHPHERHIGLAPEGWGHPPAGSLAAAWRGFEGRSGGAGRSILRAAPTPLAGGRDAFSRWLDRRVVPSVFGFDPCLQLLHPDDLVSALTWALRQGLPGVTHVVPRRPVFVRQAVRAAGRRRIALPVAWLRRGSLGDAASYLRHPFTARGDRARDAGWTARYTSRETAAAMTGRTVTVADDDEHGLDPAYASRFGRTLFAFLHDVYWRIEYRGLEHLPAEGGAVLVGVHRGFMPWDGVMMLLACHRATGRWVRFLIHPGLLKPPVLTPYMNKLGGVVACRENADWMLERGRIVGVFPEGIQGAFRLYRDWHRVDRFGRFGRDEFVRMALRHRVPIVPFATVGSAEIFPIWGRIEWPWWRRVAEWPFVPVTTPFPLPSRWHTEILPPLDVAAEHGPDAADDEALVRAISERVRARLQASIDEMRAARTSIFRGRIFEAS